MSVKLFGLMPRRPDVTADEFHDHYRHPHGTIGLNVSLSRGYVQSHQIHTDRLGPAQTTFEAVAEVWVDNEADFLAIRNEPFVVKYILPDEPKFVDIERLDFVAAREEVIRSRPTTDMGLAEGDDMWSLATRPLSVKLLHFITSNGSSNWASDDDVSIGKKLGAFRHVRCHPLEAIHGDSPRYLGVHELWWPTRTAFDQGVQRAPDVFAAFLARTGASVTLLAQAERFFS